MPVWGTLGRDPFDPNSLADGDWDALRSALAQLLLAYRAAGSPAAAVTGDDALYQSMYAQNVSGTWTLYAGNPDDPMNPDVVTNPAGSASVIVQEEGVTVITTETLNFVGDGVTVTDEGDGKATITIPGGDGGGGTTQNLFETVSAYQSDGTTLIGSCVADNATDTLKLLEGANIDISVDSATDAITIAATGLPTVAFTTIAVEGQSSVVADSASDTLTLVAGSNITITTNAAGDEIEFAAAGGGGGTVVNIFLATVNEAAHVVGTDATFAFDGTTALVGTAPASGTCANAFSRAFLNNEPLLCFGDSGGNYYGVKVSPNIARASVAESGGVALDDSTFDIGGMTALVGTALESEEVGVCDNPLALQLASGQNLYAVLKDDGRWEPLKTYDTAILLTGSDCEPRGGEYEWGAGTGVILKRSGAHSHTADGGAAAIFYNTTKQTISAGRIIQVKRIDGEWFVDVDDCAAAEEV